MVTMRKLLEEFKNSCEWEVVSTKCKCMNGRSESLPHNMLARYQSFTCLISEKGKMD